MLIILACFACNCLKLLRWWIRIVFNFDYFILVIIAKPLSFIIYCFHECDAIYNSICMISCVYSGHRFPLFMWLMFCLNFVPSWKWKHVTWCYLLTKMSWLVCHQEVHLTYGIPRMLSYSGHQTGEISL